MKKYYTLLLFSIISLTINAQLTYQWSDAAGSSTGADYGQAIATDASGNVYVTGMFTGTVDFDPSGNNFPLTSLSGSQDIFLAKYDANGNFVFAEQIAGTNDEKPFDIYVDANNIYVVGIFKGTVDFNPGIGTNTIAYNGGGTDGDGFCAKYDLSGNYVWAFRIGGTGNDRMLGVTVDGTGNVFVCGFISGPCDMDPGVGTVTFNSTLYNSYFGKYTSAGAYVFAKQLVGDYNETSDIQLDATGNIYIAGDWSQNIDFDPGIGSVLMSTSSATQIDAFFAKYTPLGIYTWAKKIGGIGVDYSMQIAVDANNVFVGGLFSNTCDFDPAIAVVNLVSAGGSDLFYARYDLSGLYQYAYGIGGTSNDYLNGMRLDATSNIFITGKFTGANIDFDPGLGSAPLTGASTGYIGEYDVSGNYITASSTGNAASEGKGIHVNGSSVYFTGSFQGTVDFDFGVGTGNETSNGGDDIFFAKYNACVGAPPTQPGTISGPTTACSSTTYTYSIAPVIGATSYTWVLPGGWSGTSTTTSINAITSSTSGTISVTANNTCGASTPQTLAVTVCTISTTINAGIPILCNGDCNATLIANPTGGCGPIDYLWTPSGQTNQTVTGLCAGSYTLTVTNSIGCTATATATITQPTPVTASTSTTFTSCGTCCDGTASVIASGGSSPYTYNWLPGNQNTPTATGLCNGTYTVCVTDANGCTTCSTVNVSFNVGLQDMLHDLSIWIKPNPAKTELTVSLVPFTSCGEPKLITIYDLLGSIVYCKQVKEYSNEIDVSGFASGIYVLEMKTNTRIIKSKFVKE